MAHEFTVILHMMSRITVNSQGFMHDDDDDDNDDDDDGRKEEQSGEESGTAEEERCRGRGVVERCGPTSKPVPLPISKTTGAPRRSTSLATAAEMALS